MFKNNNVNSDGRELVYWNPDTCSYEVPVEYVEDVDQEKECIEEDISYDNSGESSSKSLERIGKIVGSACDLIVTAACREAKRPPFRSQDMLERLNIVDKVLFLCNASLHMGVDRRIGDVIIDDLKSIYDTREV